MPDYQGNSKKMKEAADAATPNTDKKIERVVVSEVVVQKKGIGRKFKDLFIEADLKTVFRYVGRDVLLPALRNMIVDSSQRGVERLIYGEDAIRRRNYGAGPRITYNNPINRDRDRDRAYSGSRYAPPVSPQPRGLHHHSQDVFILSSREEAELVLERMNDIIDQYEFASLADLNALLGRSSTYIDNSWGWVVLGGVPIKQIREGYLIDFPPPDPI